MPTDPRPVSLFDAVKRAAQVVDPDDDDAVVGDFERAFEDADDPISALDDVQARVATVLAELDPAVNNGSLAVAGAITVYLSYRRDELHADPQELVRLAARAEWEDDVPTVVQDWLDERGLKL
jgi:ABC-type transporter Mla subunit MlaD